jgi:hypothetical protein
MKKPTLHLLSDPFNVRSLAKLYQQITGLRPRPSEIATAKRILAGKVGRRRKRR